MSGFKNIKCTRIKYSHENPYFSSILDSYESLLLSCISKKNELLPKISIFSKIEDIAECISFCYMDLELKYKKLKKCKKKYNTTIKNKKCSISEKNETIKDISKELYFKISSGESIIHIIQGIIRAKMLTGQLFKNYSSNSKEFSKNLEELTAHGRKKDWKILKPILEKKKVDFELLHAECEKLVKYFNEDKEGIGYFKKITEVLASIAYKNTKIAELLVSDKAEKNIKIKISKSGFEDITCTKIKYSGKKPYFYSVLDSYESLLESCIEKREKLLKNMSSTYDVGDVIECMMLCILNFEPKLKNVKDIKKKYNEIINNSKLSSSEKSNETMQLFKQLFYGDDSGKKHGIKFAYDINSTFKNVKLKFDDKANKPDKKSLDEKIWKKLSKCGGPSQLWEELKNALESNNKITVSPQLLCDQFDIFIKLYDKLTDGIGYFKELSDVAFKILTGATKIAEFSALNRFKKKISNMKKSVSYKSKKKISNMKKSIPDKFKNSSHSKNKNRTKNENQK